MNKKTIPPGQVKWLAVLIVMVVASIAPQNGHAFNSYLTAFNNKYGTSGTRLNSCVLCHDGSPPAVNAYGADVLDAVNMGLAIVPAMTSLEGADSDGDLAGNLAEIQARTFPGDPADKPVAAVPVIGVAPAALAFGNVRQGLDAVLTTTLTNNGTSVLSVTSLAAGGSPDFVLNGASALPLNIAAKNSYTLSVRYAPSNTGPDNGTLTIGSNDPAHPSTVVTLTGAGVSSALTIDPSVLAFGSLRQGQTANLNVTLGNTGSAECRVSSLTKSGSGDFAFGPSAPVTPFVLPPSSSVIVPIAYTPSDVGPDSGGLLVASDDPANPSVNIALSGTGDPVPASAHITVGPAALAFGPVRVGESAGLDVTIGNAGNTACVVNSLDIAGDFTFGAGAPVPPFDVAPGAMIVVPLMYAPAAPGNGIGTLSVNSTDPNSPVVNVGLSGSGVVPQMGVTPSAADFGAVTIGGNASRAVGVVNSGGAALTVTSLVLTAGAEFDYSASAPFPPFVIGPGQTTDVVLVYSPIDEGADAGTLEVGSDDPVAPNMTVTLSGSGQVVAPVPRVQVTPPALDFADVRSGMTKSLTVNVTNTGGAVAHIGTPVLGGSPDFGVLKTAFDVAPGASQEVSVTYSPNGAGSDSGTLLLTSDDPHNPSANVPMNGRGVQSALLAYPVSLGFGSVVTNGNVTRVVTLANNGTAEAIVSALSVGGSAEFALGAGTPAVPFTVAAGASVDLSLNYRPINTGTDSGTLDIASDDPANPELSVALSGTSVPGSQAVDIDITAFQVTEQYEIGISKAIDIQLSVVNPGSVLGSRTATVTGIMNGQVVYNVSLMASPTKNKKKKSTVLSLFFPSYTPKGAGKIEWTATIDDENPDSDVATATSSVVVPALDYDIAEFKVPEKYEIGFSKPMDIQLNVVNRSSLSGTRTATVVGVQGGTEVYRATAPVSAKPKGGTAAVYFKTYSTSATGRIEWTATIEDDDPDSDVATAGTSASVLLVDFDVSEFKVTEKYDLKSKKSKPLQIQMKVLNRTRINASCQATVVGIQGGKEVYRQSFPVSAKGYAAAQPTLPTFVPRAGGQILWTASIEDKDPDADQATATTLVTPLPKPVDDDEQHHD